MLFNASKKYFLCCFCLLCYCIAIAGTDSLNIKNYGAKGDGKTNDYWAILKAITTVNSRGGNCTLIFPAGDYVIDVHNTADKKYKDLEFDSCSNISVIGFSAIINVKGDYHRAAEYVTGPEKKITRSHIYSIIPFSFINCNNVVLSGFEVNGNSDKVTRDPKVVEAPSNLIRIWETENITVKDVYVHHGIAGGILIGGIKKFSKNIKFYNVISSSNAFQGMSITDARDAVFEKCRFINTGNFNGSYGSHNPAAGIDIEPIRHSINGAKTGNLKFISCRFENNVGGQIRNGRAISVDSVFFIRDSIIAASSDKQFQLVLGCGYTKMDSCYIDVGNGNFYSTSMKATDPQSTLITNSDIYIGNGKIVSTKAPSQAAVARFINNKIYCKPRQNNNNSWFDFKYGDVKFSKNEIYLPASYFAAAQKDIYVGNEKLKLHNTIKKLSE